MMIVMVTILEPRQNKMYTFLVLMGLRSYSVLVVLKRFRMPLTVLLIQSILIKSKLFQKDMDYFGPGKTGFS